MSDITTAHVRTFIAKRLEAKASPGEINREMTTLKGVICPFVFSRDGKRILSFRRVWKTACAAAGVPGRIPHDLRRAAVRNLVRAGIPERVAMTMTGHKTRSVFERYHIVSDGDLVEAARKLDLAGSTAGLTARAGAATSSAGRRT